LPGVDLSEMAEKNEIRYPECPSKRKGF